jgi:hypothetical protein
MAEPPPRRLRAARRSGLSSLGVRPVPRRQPRRGIRTARRTTRSHPSQSPDAAAGSSDSPPLRAAAPGPAPRTAFPSGGAGPCPMAARSENGLWGGLPSPTLPGSGPWGRRSAPWLSGLSAFPSRLRLPGGWCGPAPSITSQTTVRLHGAQDGSLGPKAPACAGRTSCLRRKPRQRSGPVPGAPVRRSAASPRPARLRTVWVSGVSPRPGGTAAFVLPWFPTGKIIHWRSLSPACRAPIPGRLDTGRNNSTGDHGRMPGQAFPAAAACTFFPSSFPRECPFSQFSTRPERRIVSYLWEKRPEIGAGNVHRIPRCLAACQPVSTVRPRHAASAPLLVTFAGHAKGPLPGRKRALTCGN